jgi:hypothetical protein
MGGTGDAVTGIVTRTRSKPPWEQASSRSTRAAKAFPPRKRQAAIRARLAGRRYPALDDRPVAAAASHRDRRLAVTRRRDTIARSR